MTIAEPNKGTRVDSGYAFLLSAGIATGGGFGLSVHQWLNSSAGNAEFWAASSIATGFAATVTTTYATAKWLGMHRALPFAAIFTIKRFPKLPKWPAFLALPSPSMRSAAKAREVQTETPKSPDKPLTPGQIERERRRKAREAEINKISGDSAGGVDAGKASFAAGPPSGFINNLLSTAAIIREVVPSFRSNLTDILDRDANLATRISAAISLGLKSAAIVVVGYFVYLEVLQFRGAAYKAWAEACIARQQAEINYSTLSELASGAGNNLDADCKHQ